MTGTDEDIAEDIHEAILNVMKEVGYVHKGGKNTFQNYTYAGESDLIAALRPVMIEQGIVVAITKWDAKSEVYAKKDGSPAFRTFGTATVRYTHAHSKTYMEVQALAEGTDAGDKSSYKAATGALKYANRQTFLIETGDEPEKDGAMEVPATNRPTPAVVRPTAPVVQIPAAADEPASEGLIPESVEATPGVNKATGKPYTKYAISFVGGQRGVTFDAKIADAAAAAIDSGSICEVNLRPASNPRFDPDITSLVVMF